MPQGTGIIMQHGDIPREDSRILLFDENVDVLQDFRVAVCIDGDVRVFEYASISNPLMFRKTAGMTSCAVGGT